MRLQTLLLFAFLLFLLPVAPAPAAEAVSDGLEDVRMPRLRDALRASQPMTQAWFRLRAGDAEGARRELQPAVRENPRDPDLQHLYGITAAAAGKHGLAVRALKKSLRFRSDGWVGLHLVNLHLSAGQLGPARKLVTRLEEALPGDTQVRSARVYVLVAEGDLEAARDLLQALEVDAASASVSAQLAAVLDELGAEQDAVSAMRRAVEQAPEDALYRRRLFEVLMAAGRWGDLEEAGRAPGAERAGQGVEHYYRGVALIRLDRSRAAVEALALLLDHSNPDPLALAGSSALLFQLEAWTESERASRRALQSSPEDAGLHHLLAMSLTQQAREAEGLAHYRRASELSPKEANHRFDLLVSLCKLGRLEELEALLPRALRDFDEDPRFTALSAQCLPEGED
ncbi:MAG: hypothetical protein VX498_00830 [Myxococcota bacterium]|nr:hypothetical protein [Myxococcota bacterium]